MAIYLICLFLLPIHYVLLSLRLCSVRETPVTLHGGVANGSGWTLCNNLSSECNRWKQSNTSKQIIYLSQHFKITQQTDILFTFVYKIWGFKDIQINHSYWEWNYFYMFSLDFQDYGVMFSYKRDLLFVSNMWFKFNFICINPIYQFSVPD